MLSQLTNTSVWMVAPQSQPSLRNAVISMDAKADHIAITVPVTQDIINCSDRGDADNCMLVRALCSAFPTVGFKLDWGRLFVYENGERFILSLSSRLTMLAWKWDEGENVQPFEFVVNLKTPS